MTGTRPMDPNSVIDQLLSGRLPGPVSPSEPPGLSAAEEQLLRSVVDWCATRDVARTIEDQDSLPDGILTELAKLGALRITIPQQYGGLGYSDACLLAVLSALSAEHATLCEIVAAHQVIGAVRPLVRFGTVDQQKYYLPKCCYTTTGFALNEPDLGSEPSELRTTARYDPESRGYRLTGEKCWITNATIASYVVVLAEVPPHPRSSGGVTAFLVHTDDPGVQVLARSRFAGLRGLPNGTIRFSDVALQASRRLGAEGEGVAVALACLDECRTALPITCLTTIRWCVSQAHIWASEPRQTKRDLASAPQIERHLARLATLSYLGHAVTWRAMHPECAALDREAAKVILSGAANEAIDVIMQLYGGRGYETAASAFSRGAQPFAVERVWRDTRVSRIFDGSTETIKSTMSEPFDSTSSPSGTRQSDSHPIDSDTQFLADSARELHRLVEQSAAGSDPRGSSLEEHGSRTTARVRAEAVECVLNMFVLHSTLAYRVRTESTDDSGAIAAAQVIEDARAAVEADLARLRTTDQIQRTTSLARQVVDGQTNWRRPVNWGSASPPVVGGPR